MNVNTLADLFFYTIKTWQRPDLFQVKKPGGGAYMGISTGEFARAVTEISLGLVSLGIRRGDRVAILAENRPEWLIADFAALSAGAVPVPIYPTLLADQMAYILKDSEAKAIFVSTSELKEKILLSRSFLPALGWVVDIGRGTSSEPPSGEISWSALAERGRSLLSAEPLRHQRLAAEVQSDDLATIVYTSGTTGRPKGVMLLHRNLVFNTKMATLLFDMGPADVTLSYLPLSHVFERSMTFACLYRGVSIAYAESLEKVPENMLEVRPTIMPGVPRFYEKIYERVRAMIAQSSPRRRALAEWALGVGREAADARQAGEPARQAGKPARRAGNAGTRPGPSTALRAGLGFRLGLANWLLLSKIRARTGGRVRMFVSGGAPLRKEVAEFFHAAGFTILEGYGLSETSPLVCVNTAGACKFGTVGKPAPGVEVRIAEDGEILVRGPNVMAGYFGKPEETEKVMLPGGWFATGDIGHFDEDGFLVITDRKKELLKTSGGKFVAPQPMENRLKANPLVLNAVVVGDGKKYVSALIVPNLEQMERILAGQVARAADRPGLLRSSEVRALIQKCVDEVNAGLAPYETIKRFALLPADFTIASGELTPTLKVKRRVIEERYRLEIEALYREETEPARIAVR